MQGEDEGSDALQEPLVEDYEKWIEWRDARFTHPNDGRS